MTFQAHLAYPYLAATVITKIAGLHLSINDSAIILLFSVIPDFDYVFAWSKDKVSFSPRHHTWITHTPFYYLILSVLMALISIKIAALFLIATFLHFIMDMFYTGDGIRWLRPFSDKEFYVNSPARGKHGLEWLKAYQQLPIWRIDLLFLTIAFIVFIIEYIFK